jgi:hypothetical protein
MLREFVLRDPADPETPAGVATAWFDVANDIVLTPSDEAGEPTDPGRTA